MNSNRGESKEMFGVCCGHHGGKSLLFGLAVLIVGLMLQNRYTLPDILVLLGMILIVKGILLMVFRKE